MKLVAVLLVCKRVLDFNPYFSFVQKQLFLNFDLQHLPKDKGLNTPEEDTICTTKVGRTF